MIPTLIINSALTFVVGSISTTVGNCMYDVCCAIGSYYYERKFKKGEDDEFEKE